jgi:hypothetical protein
LDKVKNEKEKVIKALKTLKINHEVSLVTPLPLRTMFYPYLLLSQIKENTKESNHQPPPTFKKF